MKMKAGTYYIGDLCYVLHDEWDEVCDITSDPANPHNVLDGVFKLSDGREFAVFSTAYGDGTYEDQDGKNYDVDSGGIGCILLSDIDQTNSNNFTVGGQIHTFQQDFEVRGMDGKIRFGGIRINTGD